jgi:archaellum biogenesis ATPase FlaH
MNHFARLYALGYTRLVPIIPPTADISPNSTLFKRVGTSQDGRGKTPGRINSGGTWGSYDWTEYENDETDLERWHAMGAGVGIKTGAGLVAIDADTLSVELATIIRDIIDGALGRLPIRVGRAPKALYLCRVSGPLPYARITFGDERVELLTEGKQFVAAGIHPKTGKPYEWPRPLVPYADLPLFEPAQLMAVMEALRTALPAASPVVVEGGGGEVSQTSLSAPLEAVARAVRATPNTSNHFATRESYVAYGLALKAALPDRPDDALELFHEWCARWTGPGGETNDPDVVDADWRRMKPPFRRGASWLFDLAEEHGNFDRVELWWQPVEEAPAPLFDIPDDGVQALDAIKWVRPSEWSGRKPKAMEWEVEGWIPKGEVTLLYGDGGIGKTLLIHQYATAAAAGLPWLGQPTRRAKVMCFFCEDSEDELHRRQASINTMLGVSYDDIDEHLRITSRKYMDNLFVLWDRNTGALKRQAVWEQLRSDCVGWGANVAIVDTLADTYAGSEIDRSQVNSFVKSCLGRLAQEMGGSVIALGHPSLSGKSSGSGTSGSTAWSNAARSRLYLRYPKGVEKGNIRELEGMKLNYGPKGNMLKLRWTHGAFDVIAGTVAPAGEDLPKTSFQPASVAAYASIDDKTDADVFDAVQAHPDAPLVLKISSINYAPKALKRMEPHLLGGYGADEVEGALLRLEARGAIKAAKIGRDAARRPQFGYVTDADKMPGRVAGGIFD